MASQPKEYREKGKVDNLIDLHVYIVPLELWLEKYHKARNAAVLESVSAGFIRVPSLMCLHFIRDSIIDQLGNELIPEKYIFLRSVGRCLAVVNRTQELVMTAADFVQPSAHSELLLLPNVNGLETFPQRDILTENLNSTKEKPLRASSEVIDESDYVHFSNISAPENLSLTPHHSTTNNLAKLQAPLQARHYNEIDYNTDSSDDSTIPEEHLSALVGARSNSNVFSAIDIAEGRSTVSGTVQLIEDSDVDSLRARILQRVEQENERLEKEADTSPNVDTNELQTDLNDAEETQEKEVVSPNMDGKDVNLNGSSTSPNLVLSEEIEYDRQEENITDTARDDSRSNSLNDKGEAEKEEITNDSPHPSTFSSSEPIQENSESVKKPDSKNIPENSIKEISSKTSGELTSIPDASSIKTPKSQKKKDGAEHHPKKKKNQKVETKKNPPENKKIGDVENDEVERLKHSQIEDLKRQIEFLRSERKTYEQSQKTFAKKREEVITEMDARKLTENNAWKKKFLAEKEETVKLQGQIEKIKKTIGTQYQKSIPIPSSKDITKKNKDGGTKIEAPSEKSNQRNMVLRLQNEINELNIRHEIIKKQLAEELTMKAFAEQELRDLRFNTGKSKNKYGIDKKTSSGTQSV